jgi:hypothetical protein
MLFGLQKKTRDEMAESGIPGVRVADTITKLSNEDRGLVIVAASHGGVYPGYIAAAGKCRGVILNDAGLGKDKSGIGSLGYLDNLAIAAATVGHETARIGDGADMIGHGRLTHVNRAAAVLGCQVGMACAEAARLMTRADIPAAAPPEHAEDRFLLRDGPIPVWGIDSNSLVRPEDKGTIVVTGSHGAILGGRPETAIRVDALAAVYHDAGVGKDRSGISRLAALDPRGIAAATVDGNTARIGDARSIWASGRISHINETAAKWGAKVGMSVPDFADIATAHATTTK